MSKHELTLERKVAASPSTVWDTLADASHFSKWMANVTKTEGAKTLKLGSVFKIHTQLGSHILVSEVKVNTFEPDKQLAWDHLVDELDGAATDMMSEGKTSFALEGTGKTTTLTARISFVPHGLKAKLGANWFLQHKIKPQMEASLQRFAKLCEA